MSSGKRVFTTLSILLSSTSLFLTACNDPPLTSPHQPSRHRFITHEITHEN